MELRIEIIAAILFEWNTGWNSVMVCGCLVCYWFIFRRNVVVWW